VGPLGQNPGDPSERRIQVLDQAEGQETLAYTGQQEKGRREEGGVPEGKACSYGTDPQSSALH
jgi:hypothetical protein